MPPVLRALPLFSSDFFPYCLSAFGRLSLITYQSSVCFYYLNISRLPYLPYFLHKSLILFSVFMTPAFLFLFSLVKFLSSVNLLFPTLKSIPPCPEICSRIMMFFQADLYILFLFYSLGKEP